MGELDGPIGNAESVSRLYFTLKDMGFTLNE